MAEIGQVLDFSRGPTVLYHTLGLLPDVFACWSWETSFVRLRVPIIRISFDNGENSKLSIELIIVIKSLVNAYYAVCHNM